MPGDQLKLGIGETRVPGQPSDCLVPKSVRGCFDASLFGVLADDLLDPPRAELAIPLRLEVPTIMGVGCDVRSQCRGKVLAEQNVSVLAALALVDPNFAGFEVHLGDHYAAEFGDPHTRVKEQPQH